MIRLRRCFGHTSSDLQGSNGSGAVSPAVTGKGTRKRERFMCARRSLVALGLMAQAVAHEGCSGVAPGEDAVGGFQARSTRSRQKLRSGGIHSLLGAIQVRLLDDLSENCPGQSPASDQADQSMAPCESASIRARPARSTGSQAERALRLLWDSRQLHWRSLIRTSIFIVRRLAWPRRGGSFHERYAGECEERVNVQAACPCASDAAS
ncbi:hypothetical protein THL1_4060 [Pseudomonas sp. TCU-HL1]|nr:hypothetical protein THL1_4060 [Pseudomonas sp. TCU-HL1]